VRALHHAPVTDSSAAVAAKILKELHEQKQIEGRSAGETRRPAMTRVKLTSAR
jgi:hypothetical protein